ncbi:MAG: hypothetical protein A2Y62_09105, partial [Candidatus Fischerbacteria bacterium RBG_13_37_8]
MKDRYALILLMFAIVVLLVIACQGLKPSPIGDITKNIREYNNRKVVIHGEVTERFSLIFIKYFKVKDATGEIAVVTDRPLPEIGEMIKVKGVVKEAFSIGDKSAKVIVEEP